MEKTSDSNQFDAIVIGSGIGGLTVAAILAKLNCRKVLILEQHFVLGGFTHEFERQHKFKWDVGLHYVGEMGKGEIGRAVSDYITDGKLEWQQMPDPFEQFVYPDLTFAQSCHPEKFKADLIEAFPEENQGIERYFADLKTIALSDRVPPILRPLYDLVFSRPKKMARLTTKEYLDRTFKNTRLKALLASQWGTYGLPPSESSFYIHAVVTYSFLKGGWYPVGGAGEIAKQIIPIVERKGGKALTQRQVTEIIIDKNVARGVKVKQTDKNDAPSEEYYAPAIISDTGAFNTYTKLIPDNEAIASYREEIQAFPKGHSALTLYLGFRESPAKLGFRGENHWLYHDCDHDRAFREQSAAPDRVIDACYLSFASLKDPKATAHTGQIIVFVDYEFFSQWQDKPWHRREREYYELKETITHNILDFVEARYPGFKEAIEYCELSTPLTLAYFDRSDRGAIYGIPGVPARLDQKWLAVKTPIKNLYLTGTDVASLGIMGAMMGGVKTAAFLNGRFGFIKVMSAIMKESAAKQAAANCSTSFQPEIARS